MPRTPLWLSRQRRRTPIGRRMEQRPLPGDLFETQVVLEVEPRLELVPALDDPELVADDPDDADDAGDEPLVLDGPAATTQDPLKLYVRSIGGGPLLTRAEERE